MKDTGGPAFPGVQYQSPAGGGTHIMTIVGGMTLRDYFAARVLAQCLENCSTNARAAEEAYIIADAMIKAREA